MNDIDSLIS